MQDFPFVLPPWDHQREFVRLQSEHNEFGALYEVGAGKTKPTIDSLRYRYMIHKGMLKTLIVGPPIVIQNWKDEILKNSNISKHDIVTVTGTGKQRLKILESVGEKTRILITNYETLVMPAVFDWLTNYGLDIMVCDEAHYLKNPRSKRAKAVYKLGDETQFRYVLTGTMILNTPMDAYGVFRFLDKGARFGTNPFAFKTRFFFDKNANMPKHVHFPDWQPQESMMAELAESIASITQHIKKEDCLDLPPLVKKKVYVELSPEQKRLYNDMRKDLLASIENDTRVGLAQLALTKTLRMQQIISGHMNVEDVEGNKSVYVIKKNPRAEALKEILAEIAGPNKVIVWAIFKQDYIVVKKICEELALKCVEVHGGVTSKQKDEAVRAFNNDSDCPVFLGHPSSGGIGINLVASNYTVYFSRSFSLGDDIQSEARNYRGGSEQHDKVTRIDLVAKDTIDETVLERLASKQKISDTILIDLVKEM